MSSWLLLVGAMLAAATPAAAPEPAVPRHDDDPFRPPSPQALRLNAEGSALYRQSRWDEARARFRSAVEADPSYLPPLVNVACSFVRQQRFGEALAVVLELLQRGGPVPWVREVQEAADLGALLARPAPAKTLREAFADAAVRWGEGLDESVLLVARLAEPMKLPADGVAVLAPRQEILAWLPGEQRYRRLTAEDGHVVALARSPDGRRVLYVTADKVLRQKGKSTALRGVVVREMLLRNVSPLPPHPLHGGISVLSISFRGGDFVLTVDDGKGLHGLVLHDNHLVPTDRISRELPLAIIRPSGVDGSPPRLSGACPPRLKEIRRAGAPVRVEARTCRSERPIRLGGPLGASLSGLPLD